MINLDPNAFLKPMSYISAAMSEWRMIEQLEGQIVSPVIAFEVRVGFMKSVELLKETAVHLGMVTTINVIEGGFQDALEQISPDRPLSRTELERLSSFADKLMNVFCAEASSRSFVALAPGHLEFMSPDKTLFGEQVDDAFPNASQEISDAGRCRSAGLWTASVMHLMRALEESLNALATDVTPNLHPVGLEPRHYCCACARLKQGAA